MKPLFLLLFVFFLSPNSSFAQTNGSVKISTTTKMFPGTYSPRQVFAIWIEDNNGAFVKTIKVQANKYIQYLNAWVAASGKNKVDAISGASITSYQTHNVVWDCKNANRSVVPDGYYWVRIEGSCRNAAGPNFKFYIKKGPDANSNTLADNANIVSTSAQFTPDFTAIGSVEANTNDISVWSINGGLQLDLGIDNLKQGTIELYDLMGKKVDEWNNVALSTDQGLFFNFHKPLSKGSYILVLNAGSMKYSKKFVLL